MKNTKGFTLIELLVVIAIIGILATGAVTVFSQAQAKARDAVRLADLNTLRSAVEVYRADNTTYPDGTSATTFDSAIEGPYVQSVPSGATAYPYNYAVLTSELAAPTNYEMAVLLEASSNLTATGAAQTDGGGQTDAYEVGPVSSYIEGASGATGANTAATSPAATMSVL